MSLDDGTKRSLNFLKMVIVEIELLESGIDYKVELVQKQHDELTMEYGEHIISIEIMLMKSIQK